MRTHTHMHVHVCNFAGTLRLNEKWFPKRLVELETVGRILTNVYLYLYLYISLYWFGWLKSLCPQAGKLVNCKWIRKPADLPGFYVVVFTRSQLVLAPGLRGLCCSIIICSVLKQLCSCTIENLSSFFFFVFDVLLLMRNLPEGITNKKFITNRNL